MTVLWLWVAFNAVLLVAMIAGQFYVAWYRHKTLLQNLEVRHAAERARFAARRQAWEQQKRTLRDDRPACPCLTGCKSPWCDK